MNFKIADKYQKDIIEEFNKSDGNTDVNITNQRIIYYVNNNDIISIKNLILLTYLIDTCDSVHSIKKSENILKLSNLIFKLNKLCSDYYIKNRKQFDLIHMNALLYKNNIEINEEIAINEVNKYLSLEPDKLYDILVKEDILIPIIE